MSQSSALVAQLAALVPGVRFYPSRVPDGAAYPAGRFFRVSGTRAATHSGGTSHRFARYQIDVYSERYTEGQDIAETIVAGLNGVRESWGGLDVSAVLADEAEDADPGERGLFHQRIDVMLGSES